MTIHLCFHGIGTPEREREPGEAHYWVGKDTFTGVLDLVARRDDVLLSFDDGNRSDVDVALPALQERGLTATFFALAGRLDDAASLAPDDLRRLHAAGMGIGTHGWDHVPWRGLSDEDSSLELVHARAALEDAAGTRITQAALPLGRYDRELLHKLKQVGYEAVFTSDRLPGGQKGWLRPRFSVTAEDTVESVAKMLDRTVGVTEVMQLGKTLLKRLR